MEPGGAPAPTSYPRSSTRTSCLASYNKNLPYLPVSVLFLRTPESLPPSPLGPLGAGMSFTCSPETSVLSFKPTANNEVRLCHAPAWIPAMTFPKLPKHQPGQLPDCLCQNPPGSGSTPFLLTRSTQLGLPASRARPFSQWLLRSDN